MLFDAKGNPLPEPEGLPCPACGMRHPVSFTGFGGMKVLLCEKAPREGLMFNTKAWRLKQEAG